MSAIRTFRKENDMTLAEVGSRLGVTKATVFKYEKRERLAAETALKIEAELGIPKWKLRPDLWAPPAELVEAAQ